MTRLTNLSSHRCGRVSFKQLYDHVHKISKYYSYDTQILIVWNQIIGYFNGLYSLCDIYPWYNNDHITPTSVVEDNVLRRYYFFSFCFGFYPHIDPILQFLHTWSSYTRMSESRWKAICIVQLIYTYCTEIQHRPFCKTLPLLRFLDCHAYLQCFFHFVIMSELHQLSVIHSFRDYDLNDIDEIESIELCHSLSTSHQSTYSLRFHRPKKEADGSIISTDTTSVEYPITYKSLQVLKLFTWDRQKGKEGSFSLLETLLDLFSHGILLGKDIEECSFVG